MDLIKHFLNIVIEFLENYFKLKHIKRCMVLTKLGFTRVWFKEHLSHIVTYIISSLYIFIYNINSLYYKKEHV